MTMHRYIFLPLAAAASLAAMFLRRTRRTENDKGDREQIQGLARHIQEFTGP